MLIQELFRDSSEGGLKNELLDRVTGAHET